MRGTRCRNPSHSLPSAQSRSDVMIAHSSPPAGLWSDASRRIVRTGRNASHSFRLCSQIASDHAPTARSAGPFLAHRVTLPPFRVFERAPSELEVIKARPWRL